jgi:hypothetical protein
MRQGAPCCAIKVARPRADPRASLANPMLAGVTAFACASLRCGARQRLGWSMKRVSGAGALSACEWRADVALL